MLTDKLSRVSIAHLPTPLEPLPQAVRPSPTTPARRRQRRQSSG
jgi:hypothetical protein